MPYAVLSALLPGLFWIWYFQRRDRFHPEPWPVLGRAFVIGAVAVLPAAALEYPFRSLIHGELDLVTAFWLSFGVVGFGEELIKLIAVYLGVYHLPEFDEPVDGIVYAVTAGVGFSVVENVLYISTFGLEVAPLRAVIASLAHASFSGVSGHFLGKAKFGGAALPALSRGLLLAAALHGVYDFILISQVVSPLFAAAQVAALHCVLLRLLAREASRSSFR